MSGRGTYNPTSNSLVNRYFHRSVGVVRHWILLAGILFGAFGFLDIHFLPLHMEWAWFIRFGIVIPFFVVMYSLTYVEKSRNVLLAVLLACLVVGVLGIDAVIAISSPQEKGYHFYYTGLLLAMAWSQMLGLRPGVSMMILISIILSYNISAVYYQRLHILFPDELLGSNFFLVTGAIISTLFTRIVHAFIREDQKKTHCIEQEKEKLLQARKDLLEADAFKDKLLSVISHDVRGPLTSIKGILHLYQRDNVTLDELRLHTKKLGDTVDALFHMLDTFFIWSIGQAENFPVVKRSISLHALVDDIANLFILLAERKSIIIKNEIDPSIRIYADDTMLNLIIRNLISNALKFCCTGSVVVCARQNNMTTEIYVEDKGLSFNTRTADGIATAKEENERGFGFGLSICRELVEKQGGTFNLQLEEGKGLLFAISIPNNFTPTAMTNRHLCWLQ